QSRHLRCLERAAKNMARFAARFPHRWPTMTLRKPRATLGIFPDLGRRHPLFLATGSLGCPSTTPVPAPGCHSRPITTPSLPASYLPEPSFPRGSPPSVDGGLGQ